MKFKWKGGMAGTLGLLVVGLVGWVYAQGQAAQTGRPQMSEEVFKDIRVLKRIPVDEIMDVMGMFSASLGYCCTDCHVKEAVGNVGASRCFPTKPSRFSRTPAGTERSRQPRCDRGNAAGNGPFPRGTTQRNLLFRSSRGSARRSLAGGLPLPDIATLRRLNRPHTEFVNFSGCVGKWEMCSA